MGYYERWYTGLVTRIIERGFVTRAEVERGHADSASVKATPQLTPAAAGELLLRSAKTEQDIELAPRFHAGDRVRGRNIHPATHTRMPRYTRGKTGVVERDRGVFNLPDSEQVSPESQPQHVYLIHYTAHELWGEEASTHDSLYIDMWEDYLEPA